jgi:hypothetical protein
MDFLKPRVCRRRCDQSNDLENPLLEATSSTAEGEHKQESSKEDQSTPHPKRLMLALFCVLFIETMAITMTIQIRSQGQEKVISPIVCLIDVGVIFVVMLAIYFRFVHADMKEDTTMFGIFLTAGIIVGLATDALSLIVADGVKHNTWLNLIATSLACMIYVGWLVFLIGYLCLIRFLGGCTWEAFCGVYTGSRLGYLMSLLLAVANWKLQEGAMPKLFSFVLAFFLAGMVACFLAPIIALLQKEVKDDDKEDEVEKPLSALVANKTFN